MNDYQTLSKQSKIQKKARFSAGLFLGPLIAIFLVGCFTPAPVTVKSQSLFPEGLEYDSNRKSFLVTSLTQGKVSIVGADGSVTPLVNDPDLISAIGLRIDKERDLLFVCSSDPGVSQKTRPAWQKKYAGLGVFSLSSGERRHFIKLHDLYQGGHFCNDIALTEDGVLYVTDSFSPVIYRINKDFKPEIFATDPRFAAKGFGLNGVVATGNHVLVAQSSSGKIFRLNKSDAKIKEIELSHPVVNADGMVLLEDDLLAVALNTTKEIRIFRLNEDRTKAQQVKVFKKGLDFPTTGVVVRGKLFYLNGKLSTLFGGNSNVDEFEIFQVPL